MQLPNINGLSAKEGRLGREGCFPEAECGKEWLDFVFARYVAIVDQVLQYSPYGMTRDEREKGAYMLHDAKRVMEKLKDAPDNEALFKAQNELRGICAAVVDAGLQAVEGSKEV